MLGIFWPDIYEYIPLDIVHEKQFVKLDSYCKAMKIHGGN
jgi:hypothetical protein